jgi:hypothetical protein
LNNVGVNEFQKRVAILALPAKKLHMLSIFFWKQPNL